MIPMLDIIQNASLYNGLSLSNNLPLKTCTHTWTVPQETTRKSLLIYIKYILEDW